nr:hypothetical protein [Tanacetum cinerariifolium]
MNPQETQQVVAHDEKWVPSTERLKISSTNVRLETTVKQKEKTFQVIINVSRTTRASRHSLSLQKSLRYLCSISGTLSRRSKTQNLMNSFLANKKYIVDAEVFRKILDIYPRVKGEDFTESKGKGSQGKKTAYTPVADVDVSEESDSEQARKRTASRRVDKKKVTISATDNIIPDLDVALELEDSQVLKAQVKELVGYQGFPMSPQSSLLPQSKYSKEDQSEDKEVDWIDSEEDDEKKDDIDDDKSIDLEMTDDEETEDEFLQGKEQVNDDEDKEMTNAEFEEPRNGDEENTNVAKADAEKNEEVKDDAKKAEVPPTSSSLSVSSGFGDQFLKLSSDTSLIGTVKDTTDVEINSLLDIKIQYEVPHIQSLSLLRVPVSLRVAKLEKDVSELKKIDHSAEALATLKSQVLTVVYNYLGSKFGDVLQKEMQKHVADLIQIHSVKLAPELTKIQTAIVDLEQESEKSPLEIHKIKREQAEKQKMSKYAIKSTDKAILKEYDQKSALYQTMHENKSFNRNLTNHALYHALIEALIKDENAMDKRVADTTKRRRTKESESSKKPSTTKETSKGKAPSKSSKTGKSAAAKEPVEEPIAEVVMDDAVNTASVDVVRDDDQPQDTLEPKTY